MALEYQTTQRINQRGGFWGRVHLLCKRSTDATVCGRAVNEQWYIFGPGEQPNVGCSECVKARNA